MKTFRLQCLREHSFNIALTPDFFQDGDTGLADAVRNRKLLVISSRTVSSHYQYIVRSLLQRYTSQVAIEVIDLSERAKVTETLLQVCSLAQKHGMGRDSLLVAVGGGVCCDITGFTASIIRRGIAYVRIPTTLLAMVDAAVGLKCGVNLGDSKNYLGSFFPPRHVVVCPSFLATLPAQHLRQGLSEIVKMALVRDQELFSTMESAGTQMVEPAFFLPDGSGHRVIARAIALMVEELAKNPFEAQGLQRLVDFGHTFSPTLEALTGYTMLHGDAVAIDMMLTAEISHRLGLLRTSDLERMHALFQRLDLPSYSPVLDEEACRQAIAGAMLHRGGSMNLVVPTAIGEAAFIEDPEVITPLLGPSLLALCRRAEAGPQPDDHVGTAWSRAS